MGEEAGQSGSEGAETVVGMEPHIVDLQPHRIDDGDDEYISEEDDPIDFYDPSDFTPTTVLRKAAKRLVITTNTRTNAANFNAPKDESGITPTVETPRKIHRKTDKSTYFGLDGRKLASCIHSDIPTSCRICHSGLKEKSRPIRKNATTSNTSKPIARNAAQCEHKSERKCLLSTRQCCECSDVRPMRKGYKSYIDGVGYVRAAFRHSFYCQNCHNHAESVRLSGRTTGSSSRISGRRQREPSESMKNADGTASDTSEPRVKVFFIPQPRTTSFRPSGTLLRVAGATRPTKPSVQPQHIPHEPPVGLDSDDDDCTVISLDSSSVSGYVSHMSASSWSHLTDPSRASIFRIQEQEHGATASSGAEELRACGHRCEVRFRDGGVCCECADSREASETYYIWAVRGVEDAKAEGEEDWEEVDDDDDEEDERDGVLVETDDRKALYCGSCRIR